MKVQSRTWMLLILLLSAGLHSACSFAVTPPQGTLDHSADSIINGTNTSAGTYPWMVALLSLSRPTLPNSQRQFCGGSLITPEWVLTAAHCVDWQKPDKFQVWIGSEDLDAGNGQLLAVSAIVVNPHYEHVKYSNDIALLHLTTAAAVKPVALVSAANAGSLGNIGATVLGWGSTTGVLQPECTLVLPTTTSSSSPSLADVFTCKTLAYRKQSPVSNLQSGQMNVLTSAQCNHRYLAYLKQHNYSLPASLPDDTVLYPDTLCVADPINKVNVCFGDSGGPLLVQQDGKLVLAGIGSFLFESNCQGPNNLQFFTDVAQFLGFIYEVTNSNPNLNSDHVCPEVTSPLVQVEAGVAGKSSVKISWNKVVKATAYSLLYVRLPRADESVGTLLLPATTAEFTTTLPSGSHYLVALQTTGAACDSPVSTAVEVVVP